MALMDLIPNGNRTIDPNQPPDPPPSPMPLPDSLGGLPSFGSLPGGLKPLITSPRQQQEQGLMGKINAYDNPDPQQPGFWHKLGHIAARVGNIAGDIVDPGLMAAIPGTDLNKGIQHSQNVRELAGLQGEDRADMDEFEKRALEGAQIEETKARTEAIKNAPDKQPNWERIETDQGIFAHNPQTNELMPLTFNGKALKPFQKDAKEENPAVETQRDLLDAESKGDTARINKDKQELKDLNPLGEQRLAVEVGNRDNKQDASTRQAAFKAYTPAMDSAERFNVMAKNYEDAVKNHDQQAMLSLLANHLGMTMGLQKGARMTKDIIREAQQSRPWLQGMESKFDKDGYLQGVTLTPEQMRQMVDLGRERFSEDITKAHNEASYLGATDNGPDRTPNKSVINHYIGLAGGDVNKAKQLAAQDGWTVK